VTFFEIRASGYSMGILEKIISYSQKQAYTQEYSEADAKEAAENVFHEVSSELLRMKKPAGKRAPLDRVDESEPIRYLISGTGVAVDGDKEANTSQLIITPQRTIIVASGLLPISSVHSVAHRNLNGIAIQRQYGLEIKFQTAGHTFVVNPRSQKTDVIQDAADYVRKSMNEAQSQTSDSSESVIEQLEKLTDMRDQGIISEEEFQEKKNDIINGN
jgi:hypothetical protein